MARDQDERRCPLDSMVGLAASSLPARLQRANKEQDGPGANHLDIRPWPSVIIDNAAAVGKPVILGGIDVNAIPIRLLEPLEPVAKSKNRLAESMVQLNNEPASACDG